MHTMISPPAQTAAERHDELVARSARTLREVDADPSDWLEGPRERRVARLHPAGDPPLSLARLGAALGGLAVGSLVVGLVTALVEVVHK